MRIQLPFDMPFDTAFAAEDFLAAESNFEARGLVKRWRDWPARSAAIWGEAGAGKTHLAHIWASQALAEFANVEQLANVDEFPQRLVLDLADGAFPADHETALFHLLNLTRERGGALLIVSRDAPSRWPVSLPDLRSRLRALPSAEMTAPDDGLLAAVLMKQCADRQLAVDAETVDYLLARSERSFAAMQNLAWRLDRTSLKRRRRRITIPIARETLEEQSDHGSRN